MPSHWLRSRIQRKVVVTFHGGEEEILSQSVHSWRSGLERACLIRTVSRAHELTAVNSELAKSLSYHLGRKVSVVFNGIDVDAVRSLASQGLARTHLPERERNGTAFLVFPGRLIARLKGQDIMIEAFAKLLKKGFDAVLSFTGTGEDLEMLENLATHLGIRERIVFLGYLPRDMQLAYMAHSDVIVTHLIRDEFNSGFVKSTLKVLFLLSLWSEQRARNWRYSVIRFSPQDLLRQMI